MLKTIILILLALVLISLASSLAFLFIDRGNPNKKRILYGLGFRVTLGVILVILIIYGVYWRTWQQRSWNLKNINKQEETNPNNVNKMPIP